MGFPLIADANPPAFDQRLVIGLHLDENRYRVMPAVLFVDEAVGASLSKA